jgi:hypothetical protein
MEGAEVGVKVPYLARPDVQSACVTFENFRQYNGFPVTDNADGLISYKIGPLTKFLQSWLFFELISAFLGRPSQRSIDRDHFADKHGFIKIGQDKVHGYFREWRAELSKSPHTRKREVQKRIGQLIRFAQEKSDIFEEAADRLETRNEDFDKVALSVKLLINLLQSISDDTFSTMGSRLHGYYLDSWMPNVVETLRPYISDFFRGPYLYDDQPLRNMGWEEVRRYLASQPKMFVPLPPGDDRGGRAAQCLLRLFEENGWCPYRAQQLCRSYDYLAVNKLACLKRVEAIRNGHNECMQNKRCCAHDLNSDEPNSYPFQHVCGDTDSCKLVDVPDKVTSIIKSGGIPLISMRMNKNDLEPNDLELNDLDLNDLDLKVVRCTPYITYTAISHVWSDGLGNPTSNALPLCQLFRLRRMISRTYSLKHSPFYDDQTTSLEYNSSVRWHKSISYRPGKPHATPSQNRVYFWMDTLCIPTSHDSQTAGDEDLKLRAIKHITPIFAGAFNTLVLDRGIEEATVGNASQVSGDKLAALVLSSKWMQRGWTLEEGSLAQTCVFQLNGMPYEMSDSLKNQLPQVEWHHSPLERASINAGRLIPLLLTRALSDEKRQLTTDPRRSRRVRLTKLLRVPQFVHSWNSLLERSTTKPNDGPIILANLLDFNVYSLKLVPKKERLKLLIQNCDELPLSLLYNTGPRICISNHPELGWIPRKIAGDHLTVGAVLRRINPKQPGYQVKFEIDWSDSNQESIVILRTVHGTCIPYDTEVFTVSAANLQKYYIEIQRPSKEGSAEEESEEEGLNEEIQNTARRIYNKSKGTCIVIDLACGTLSRRGFAGRGARFYINSCKDGEMTLQYDAALIAWTAEQWQHRYKLSHPVILSFETEHVAPRERLLLNYSKLKTLYYRPAIFKAGREDRTLTFHRDVTLGHETCSKENI